MTHAATLLVPMGVPRVPPRIPWQHRHVGATERAQRNNDERENASECEEADGWSETDSDAEESIQSSGSVWSSAWFHVFPASDRTTASQGEARFAIGGSDGSISIFSRTAYSMASESISATLCLSLIHI